MATSKPDPVGGLKNILTCSICLHIFNSPKTLPCAHSFCEQCLDQNVKKTKQDGHEGIQCPLCRVFYKKGEYIHLPVLVEILEFYNSLKKTQNKICFLCDDETEIAAVWTCVNCKIPLCEACKKKHKKTPNSITHTYRPCEVETTMDCNIYCKNHSDHLIDLYCVDCKKCMCLKCKVTNHEGHKAETIAFSTEELTQEIIKKLFVVIKDIKELRYQENCLKKQINVVQTKSNAEKQHYKDTKEDDISRIEERYKANIQRLDETEKHNLKEIEVAKEKIQAQIDVKQNITDLCEATMATASGSSLLMGLTEGLIQKVSEEEQKVVGNTSVTLWHPKHHVLDYWNYPSFYDEFKIFSP